MCKVWILEFGDFGFWGFWILGILDFGFWGSWILDFGLGILDGHLVTKFWMLHKKRRLCTPNRVGGLYIIHTPHWSFQRFSHQYSAPPLTKSCGGANPDLIPATLGVLHDAGHRLQQAGGLKIQGGVPPLMGCVYIYINIPKKCIYWKHVYILIFSLDVFRFQPFDFPISLRGWDYFFRFGWIRAPSADFPDVFFA